MTDQDVKEILSKEVIRIIFDTDTSVNWSNVDCIIRDEMPEHY